MKIAIYALGLIALSAGCNGFVEIDSPKNQLTTDKVFNDTGSATAALMNAYALLDRSVDVNYTKLLSMYTDELDYTGSTQQFLEFFHSNISPDNSTDLNIWKNCYFIIYQCNDLVAQLQKNVHLPSEFAADLVNEARFLRAYAYFYLFVSYGPVPLILTTDVSVSVTVGRTDSASLFDQIIRDLKAAREGLPDYYINDERVRANRWAATALLARVYLYQKKWTAAEAQATEVITSGLFTPLPSLEETFKSNSRGAILQIWTQEGIIADADNLIPNSGLPRYPLTQKLFHAFEIGDQRKYQWTKPIIVSRDTFYYPYKYHNRTDNVGSPEYLMVMRLAEQYLIRAEARAHEGKITGVGGAEEDLNVIRTRAGLSPLTAASSSGIFTLIAQERYAELFCESGHRFLDLKRTGQLNSVMSSYKGSWRNDTAVYLPIPQAEITYAPNLTQNIGY